MKKIKIIVLCAIMALSSLVLFGCGDKKSSDKFIEVASVTCDGVTYQSKFEVIVGDLNESIS